MDPCLFRVTVSIPGIYQIEATAVAYARGGIADGGGSYLIYNRQLGFVVWGSRWVTELPTNGWFPTVVAATTYWEMTL